MFVWDFVTTYVMSELLNWIFGQVVSFLGNFFALMGSMGAELFEMEWVQAVVGFFSHLGWALFGVGLVVCCFECGIGYASGRADVRQTALNILKGFLAVSLFTTVPVRLYALSVSLQGELTSGIAGMGTRIGDVGLSIIETFQDAEGLEMVVEAGKLGLSVLNSPAMALFCIILMAYAVVKVFFANLKRGGILLIQIAVGSLYMFSVPRGYIDGFVQWTKQIIGLCLTAFLQSTILVAGLMVFRENALMGLGLMLSAGEVPHIAGAFGLDTSVHANLSSAMYTVQSAVSTTKVVAAAVGGK